MQRSVIRVMFSAAAALMGLAAGFVSALGSNIVLAYQAAEALAYGVMADVGAVALRVAQSFPAMVGFSGRLHSMATHVKRSRTGLAGPNHQSRNMHRAGMSRESSTDAPRGIRHTGAIPAL